MTTPSFADLGVRESLIKVLATRGVTTPYPIQIETLPDTLAGRDVLGRGKTGSGKTLAFSIPLGDPTGRLQTTLLSSVGPGACADPRTGQPITAVA